MKRNVKLLLLFILPTVAFGQTWRNGTITTKDGTVVKAQINDLESNYAFTEISFRKDGQSSIEKYSVNDIVSFATNRPALFESHTVTYDGDTQEVTKLPEGKEPTNRVTKKIFLQVLVNAKIGLLYLRDENERSHYFIKQDTLITELLNRNYKNPNDNTTMLEYPAYIQQLTLITNDCQNLQKRFSILPYKENQLSLTIKEINRCKGNPLLSIWEGEVVRKPSSFGLALHGFVVEGYSLDFGTTFGEVNFGAGAFFEFYSRKKPNRISLYNELIYKNLSQQALYGFSTLEKTYECQKIKLLNALRISYNNKSGSGGRFYFGVGIETGVRRNETIGEEEMNLGSGFEYGPVLMLGETFVLFNAFKMNTELRFEFEMSHPPLTTFYVIGLSTQFYIR